ncbi:MAG TPA: hypothetical protein VKQ70_10430 [Caulobacteraceae bacterium]|nr:hypothetical protein [Caulobacteraceae bacterium]
MALGPGKYDDLATVTRKRAKARGVIVIVFEGHLGNGFSVQTLDPQLIVQVPAILRDVAAGIEADLKRGQL